jgi:hypothetical protein
MVAGLPDDAIYKIMRGNAIRMLSLDLDADRDEAGNLTTA